MDIVVGRNNKEVHWGDWCVVSNDNAMVVTVQYLAGNPA
jgi:hypothetical protein